MSGSMGSEVDARFDWHDSQCGGMETVGFDGQPLTLPCDCGMPELFRSAFASGLAEAKRRLSLAGLHDGKREPVSDPRLLSADELAAIRERDARDPVQDAIDDRRALLAHLDALTTPVPHGGTSDTATTTPPKPTGHTGERPDAGTLGTDGDPLTHALPERPGDVATRSSRDLLPNSGQGVTCPCWSYWQSDGRCVECGARASNG